VTPGISAARKTRRIATPAVRFSVAVFCSIAGLLGDVRAGFATAPSPALRAQAEAGNAAARAKVNTWLSSRGTWVDRVDKSFALDLTRYPRGEVAHRNILVVLAKFPSDGDGLAISASSNSTPGYYQRLFFSDDPNDGFTSVREYYREASKGRLIISGQVTSDWLQMPHSYGYYVDGTNAGIYGPYPRNGQGLAEAAMNAAFQDFGGDLRYFDNDGPDGVTSSGDDDGFIDAVCVIHPERGGELSTAPPVAIWSHESGVGFGNCSGNYANSDCKPGLQLGNVRGYLYLHVGEFNDFPGDHAMGTYCHEFGHTLGLPDLYDYYGVGLGFYSLMGLGNYLPFYTSEGTLGSRPSNFDPWCRQFLGFDSRAVVTEPGPYSLAPVSKGGGSLQIWRNGEPGDEYLLVENRGHSGNDRFLPADGLVVYRVDERFPDNTGGPAFYRVRVLDADSLYPRQLEIPIVQDANGNMDPTQGNYGDARDSWPGALLRRSLTESSTPDTRDRDGFDTGVRLYNMSGGSVDGSETASFDLVLGSKPELRLAGSNFQDGNDDRPGAGESGDLTVSLKNIGVASGALSLSLASLDPLVLVTQNSSNCAAIGPGLTGQSSPAFSLQLGTPGSLQYDARVRLSWTDGTNSGALDFAIMIGQVAGLNESFSDDFALSGWTSQALAPSVANEWHRTSVRYRTGGAGGTLAAKVGSLNQLGVGSNEQQTYRSNQDAALISPSFDLAPNSQLTFWSLVDTETNGGFGAWDGGRAEISLDGGDWVPLEVDRGYPYFIEFLAGTALAYSSVIAGSSNGQWRQFVADLSMYQGPARIRFRFASDGENDPRDQYGGLLRYYEGWYVDDVSVGPRVDPGPAPHHVAFRAGPTPYFAGGGFSTAIYFRLSAPDGLPHSGERPVIRIYDVSGRRVREVTASPDQLVPAEFTASWDGKNNLDAPVGAGVYFAKVTLLGQTQTTRLVVVR